MITCAASLLPFALFHPIFWSSYITRSREGWGEGNSAEELQVMWLKCVCSSNSRVVVWEAWETGFIPSTALHLQVSWCLISELVSLKRHGGRTALQDLGCVRRTAVLVSVNPFAFIFICITLIAFITRSVSSHKLWIPGFPVCVGLAETDTHRNVWAALLVLAHGGLSSEVLNVFRHRLGANAGVGLVGCLERKFAKLVLLNKVWIYFLSSQF